MAQFSSQPPSQPLKGTKRPFGWLTLMERWSEWLIGFGLLGASLLLFITHLGNVPLRDWDEGLVAQVAKEIALTPFAQQTWLHPTLHGQPYFNKPPFVHWLVAIAYSLGGIHEWTARLPGACATAFSVVLLYILCRELFPQRLIAVFTAWIYLTLLPVVRHGRLAMLDGMILYGFMALLICTLRVRRAPQWSVGIGLCFSLLCLTKGLLGFLLLAIALGFLAWDAPRLLKSVHWWVGLIMGSLPVVLWYVAQGVHYGALFWDAHIVEQAFNRAVNVVEQHHGPPWYYLVELLKYSWPWLLFLPMGIRAVYCDRGLSWSKLATVWGIGYLGLISVMSTKLPWYIMPLYPVIAMVIGVELYRLWQTLPGASPTLTPSNTYQRIILGFLVLMAIAGWGGALYYGGYLGFDQNLTIIDGTTIDGRLALTLTTLALTMTGALLLLKRGDRQFISILLWGFYLSLLLFMSSNHWVWELGEDYPVKPVADMIRSALLTSSSPTPTPSSTSTPLNFPPVTLTPQSLPEPSSINSANPSHRPPNLQILTSHPYHRPSLDFYSDHKIQPIAPEQIKQKWRNPSTVLLLPKNDWSKFKLKRVQQLGQTDDWILIQRKSKNR